MYFRESLHKVFSRSTASFSVANTQINSRLRIKLDLNEGGSHAAQLSGNVPVAFSDANLIQLQIDSKVLRRKNIKVV